MNTTHTRRIAAALALAAVATGVARAEDYYVAPVYPMVFAAGATAIDRFAKARRQSWVLPAATAALVSTS